MGKVTGFIEIKRQNQPYRPINERLKDFKQVVTDYPESVLNQQASRCMDLSLIHI